MQVRINSKCVINGVNLEVGNIITLDERVGNIQCCHCGVTWSIKYYGIDCPLCQRWREPSQTPSNSCED